MNKVFVTIVGILVVGAIGWLVFSGSSNHEEMRMGRGTQSLPERQAGERAPNFSLQDYSGKTVSFVDFAGKPMVINSWAAPMEINEIRQKIQKLFSS